ncbi:hypothetical protein NADFUDRAFT_45023 [Nadsonia fulvescens var. elongata DSM 6958]|uniref:DM2 domain-containing protein n=1 Tax=Nadsonia fulvescens var. elongata DSM 6958 TaxID=857566 RepID=A0A1E3PT01_9ASCO|nr:hypothetical protein NADFUDRAFT_45023 [Nadsonia fulvescens var. elongata DSM 6958]
MDYDNLHARLRPTIDAYIQAHNYTSDKELRPARIRYELQELLGFDLDRIRSTFDLEIQRRLDNFKQREADGTHDRVRVYLEKQNKAHNEITVLFGRPDEREIPENIVAKEEEIENALETNKDYLYLLPSRDLSDRIKWGASSRHIGYMRRGLKRLVGRKDLIERQKYEYQQNLLARGQWLKEVSKTGKIHSASGLKRERSMTPDLKAFFNNIEESKGKETMSLTVAVRLFWAYVRDNGVERRDGSVICNDIMKPVFGETTNSRDVCKRLSSHLLKDSSDKYVKIPALSKKWRYRSEYGSPLNPEPRKQISGAPDV